MAQPLAADVEMLPLPRTYTDAEFTKLEARLLAAHGQATKDGALGTVLDAAATEVLFRLTGQHGLQFRDSQRDVLEHIIYGVRSTFYLAPCGAGKSLVLWVLSAWTRRIVVVITPTNTLAASHCTVVPTALGGKSCTVVPLRAARARHARGAADGVGARTRAACAGRALRLATATPGRRVYSMKLVLPTFSFRCVVPCRQLLHGHGTALNTLSLTLLFASAARARRSLLPARPRRPAPAPHMQPGHPRPPVVGYGALEAPD